jgi:hypothetical protein
MHYGRPCGRPFYFHVRRFRYPARSARLPVGQNLDHYSQGVRSAVNDRRSCERPKFGSARPATRPGQTGLWTKDGHPVARGLNRPRSFKHGTFSHAVCARSKWESSRPPAGHAKQGDAHHRDSARWRSRRNYAQGDPNGKRRRCFRDWPLPAPALSTSKRQAGAVRHAAHGNDKGCGQGVGRNRRCRRRGRVDADGRGRAEQGRRKFRPGGTDSRPRGALTKTGSGEQQAKSKIGIRRGS